MINILNLDVVYVEFVMDLMEELLEGMVVYGLKD
jgi:hypothetical protein